MKGKKVDSEFVSEYIAQSIGMGFNTPEEIIKRAEEDIKNINFMIEQAEKSKIQRSKILDVINTFGKDKPDKSEEIRALSFFKLQHPDICQYICATLKEHPVSAEDLLSTPKHNDMDIVFCLKQLLEAKVIAKSGTIFIRGVFFDEYLKFVLKE